MDSFVRKATNIFPLLLLFFNQSSLGQPDSARWTDVIRHSNFIFSGTIVKMDSSNISGHVLHRPGVVRVKEVLDAPPNYYKAKGEDITIDFSSDTFAIGKPRVFFVWLWYFGQTLGGREVPNTLTFNDENDLTNQIRAARKAIAEDSLRVALAQAAVVILGRVVASDSTAKALTISEHDPQLRRAVIQVHQVLKGSSGQNFDTVYYASSSDRAWKLSPRLNKGLDGIFLLHPTSDYGLSKLPGFLLLDPMNLQPASQIDTIKRLLKFQ